MRSPDEAWRNIRNGLSAGLLDLDVLVGGYGKTFPPEEFLAALERTLQSVYVRRELDGLERLVQVLRGPVAKEAARIIRQRRPFLHH